MSGICVDITTRGILNGAARTPSRSHRRASELHALEGCTVTDAYRVRGEQSVGRPRRGWLAAATSLVLVGGTSWHQKEAQLPHGDNSRAPQPGFLVTTSPFVDFSSLPASIDEPQDVPREWHEFYFARAAYNDGGRRGRSWRTDYPKADRQFVTVLQRITNLDVHDGEFAISLTDPNIHRFPFLYALEVGYMRMSSPEITNLRDYLLSGGFLVIDDFWGTREWQNFEYQMSLVLPEFPIVDLPMEHPIFSTFYKIDEILQVPGYGFRGGATSQRDGFVPQVKGIMDGQGHLMVVINWNTDLGDAWEWAEQPDYPLRFSTYAYQMGVNMIVYAMSH